jgi:predicted  nucleic acid-binding Zn-ribbon protein
MTEKLQSELETTRGVCAAHLGTVSDVSKAESTISVLQCDVAKRDRQIIDLLEQLKSVTEASQAELSSAHSDLSAARQQVLTLEERLLACDAGMDDLRHLINSSDATASAREHHHAVIVGQLQENVHALETQVADLRIAAHSAEHSLAAELQHAQHTIHELEKKIVLQEQELSKRDRHIFGLCEQFDEAVSALHSERSRNDVAANDMLRQVTELRTHLEERDRCILDLESQLDSLKVTNQSQQDGGVLPAMFEALNAELEAAQVALRVAEESLGTVSAERDILMQQLSRMATKLAEIHETKVSTARISETAGVHHNLEDDIPPVVCSAPSETNSPSYAVAPSHGLVTHLDEHSVPDQPVAVVPSVVTSDDRLLRLDHRTNEVHRLRRFYSVLSKFLVDVDDSPLRRLLDDKKFAPRVRLVGANARLSSRSSSSGETKASRLPNVWRY